MPAADFQKPREGGVRYLGRWGLPRHHEAGDSWVIVSSLFLEGQKYPVNKVS